MLKPDPDHIKRLANLLVSISEPEPSEQKQKGTVQVSILGLSENVVAEIQIDQLPPGAARSLLKILSADQKLEMVRAETVETFLKQAIKFGGKVFSDELGIFPKRIIRNYIKLCEATQEDEASYDFLVFEQGADGWKKLDGDLLLNVKDQKSFVWIRAETPLSTGRAHEDKLDFIIKNIMKQCERTGSSAFKEVLEEAWIKERGVSFDLRIVHKIPGEYFKVDKSKLLMLSGKGFVMTVFSGDLEIKKEFYKALNEPINGTQFNFIINALEFGLERNHLQMSKLYQRQAELQAELPYKNLDKSIDLLQISDNIEQLIDSARYIRDESEDYIEAIQEFPKTGLQEDQLNVLNDTLDYARDVHETGVSLHEDSVELRGRIKEIRDEFLNDLNIAAVTTIPLVTIVSVATVWRDFDLVSIGLIAATAVITFILNYHVSKKRKG